MSIIQAANSAWLQVMYDVVEQGIESQPRGQAIKELIGYQSCVDMQFPLISVQDRDMGYKFAAGEAAWIISGDDRVSTIAPFSRAIKHFSDDGEKFFGAYGPKIEAQLQYVVFSLMNDPDSRQAVLNIWRENPPKSKDIPCTLSAQWLVRGNKLHCIDTMRSSDVWLGWVYDVFNFTMLSSVVLLDLKIGNPTKFKDLELGYLTLNAGSQHIYKRDWDKVEKIITQTSVRMDPYPAFEPHKVFRTGQNLLDQLWVAANNYGALEFMRLCGKEASK